MSAAPSKAGFLVCGCVLAWPVPPRSWGPEERRVEQCAQGVRRDFRRVGQSWLPGSWGSSRKAV